MASIVKQIREFGLTADIVPFYLAELDVDAVGQALLAGLRSAVTFYWNRMSESRAFAGRFKAQGGRPSNFCRSAAVQRCDALSEGGPGGWDDGRGDGVCENARTTFRRREWVSSFC